MKTKILFIAMLMAFASCKKDNETAPADPVPAAKTYVVDCKFLSSDSTSTNFTISYLDEHGNTVTVNNGFSGWTHSFVGTAGQYVSMSAQSHTINASVDVAIYYNSMLLCVKHTTGTGISTAQASTEGTLPQ